eukprot:2986651-Prymnesium_polylepis.1
MFIEVVPRLMCWIRDHIANASAAGGVKHGSNVSLSHADVFDVLAQRRMFYRCASAEDAIVYIRFLYAFNYNLRVREVTVAVSVASRT